MAEFRAGLIADVPATEVSDAEIGTLLDLLKHHNGALEIEADRLVLVYSFDSGDLPGLMSGLVAAIPRASQIGGTLLKQANLLSKVTVIGISVERVGE